jgi:hypothetical protein
VATTLLSVTYTPQSTHTYCSCPLQDSLQLSAAQSCAAWSVSGHDARCFSMHALNPRTCTIALSTADSLQLPVQHSLGAFGLRHQRRRIVTHASIHVAYAALSTADRIAVQRSLRAALRSGYDAHCFSMHTRLNPRTCIALSTVDSLALSAAQSCALRERGVATTLVVSVAFTASIRDTHCSVHCRLAAAQCSKSWCCLGLARPSLPRQPPQSRTCTLQSTADSLQLSAHCSLVAWSEWLRRLLFQHAHASIHAHAFSLCPP